MSERKLFAVAQRWVKLILPFRQRGSSRFYLGFARLGVVIVLAGVAPWFPSVWQQLLEWAVELTVIHIEQFLDTTTEEVPEFLGWKVGISAFCLIAGFSITFVSLMMFDRANRTNRPGRQNEDAIALNIQSNTSLEKLVASAAAEYGVSVKLDEISPESRGLTLTPGHISASSFGEFLDQVSLRTTPPNQVLWDEEGDGFFVARAPEIEARS